MKKRVLTIIFLAIALAGFSQDYIVKKDGGKIDCKITKEDSANVYITILLGGTNVNSEIKRKDIQSISYGNRNEQTKNIDNGTTPNFQKNCISFNMGGSIPSGDYASTNITGNEKAGCAESGRYFDFKYTHLLTTNLGFGVKLSGSSCDFKTAPMTSELKTQTGYTWTANSPDWFCSSLLGGIIINFKDKSDTHYEFSLWGGSMGLASPEMNYSCTVSNTTYWMKYNSTTENAWGYDIGFSISHLISKHWSLAANIDYMSSSFSFNNIEGTNSIGQSQTLKLDQPFDVINISAGLGYNF